MKRPITKSPVDEGFDPPEPWAPSNRRALAALDEAVARSASAVRTLDAIDVVLEEQSSSARRKAS